MLFSIIVFRCCLIICTIMIAVVWFRVELWDLVLFGVGNCFVSFELFCLFTVAVAVVYRLLGCFDWVSEVCLGLLVLLDLTMLFDLGFTCGFVDFGWLGLLLLWVDFYLWWLLGWSVFFVCCLVFWVMLLMFCLFLNWCLDFIVFFVRVDAWFVYFDLVVCWVCC